MGVNRNILNLAVPSILANITVPLVGMADIAVAGHLDAGNAVSSATLIGGVAIEPVHAAVPVRDEAVQAHRDVERHRAHITPGPLLPVPLHVCRERIRRRACRGRA